MVYEGPKDFDQKLKMHGNPPSRCVCQVNELTYEDHFTLMPVDLTITAESGDMSETMNQVLHFFNKNKSVMRIMCKCDKNRPRQ